MKISIIIPVYNGGEKFRRCIDSILAVDDFHELIVVDDSSTDDSVQYAAHPQISTVRTPTRSGPAFARNLGAQHATGDVLFFVDADVTFHADTLLKVHESLNNPEFAAVIGSYDDAPAEENFLSQYRNLLHHFVHQNAGTEASTFWGACGAIRRDVFNEIGGFDATQYPEPSIEDIELGYRLRASGYRILLNKALLVKHLKHWDAQSIIMTDVFRRAIPWAQLLREQDTVANDLNISQSGRISVALAGLFALSSILAVWLPRFALISGISGSILMMLNRALYRFFFQKYGFQFMIFGVCWHYIYFIYSGLAYFYVQLHTLWHYIDNNSSHSLEITQK